MDFYAEIEELISAQGPVGTSPADILAEIGSPSISIAVLDHCTITSKCISTVGDNSETLFQACSISKPLAGMATMRLVQQGKLQLDDKIVNLLSKHVVEILETPHTSGLLQQITVRHLMSHTSGLAGGAYPGYAKVAPETEVVLSGKAPVNTLHTRVEGIPGYQFSYSGGGITVLQVILETVTGKDFSSLMKELVFEPLEMTRSFYILPDGETNITKAHFTGYTQCDAEWHTQPEKAAAGLWTTPTDLLKTIRAMQRSLKSDGEATFLEREIAQEMLSEVQNTMALTWMAPQDPGTAFGHGGSNFPGWECFLMGYADLHGGRKYNGDAKALEDCGICLMTNSMNGFTVWSKVFHAISYIKRWTTIPHFDGRSPIGKTPFCAYGVDVDARWVDWKGTWVDGEKELSLDASEKSRPLLCFGPNMKIELVTAAIPSVDYGGEKGTSVDLVPEGLDILIRLGWKQEKRYLEFWRGANQGISGLERK